jgi:predicted nucleic acid-binding protein
MTHNKEELQAKLMIALANKLTLVTHITRKFERVEGLQIEDWEVEM